MHRFKCVVKEDTISRLIYAGYGPLLGLSNPELDVNRRNPANASLLGRQVPYISASQFQ